MVALRFKLDENIPERASTVLREFGHDVQTVLSEGLAGADDNAVHAACIAESRILVTLDLDFADIRTYPPGAHAGIWVLRPSQQTFGKVANLVAAAARLAATELATGQLWVIDDQRVRIRG